MNISLIYDFDGTIAEGNCAEHGPMPALGISDFNGYWRSVNEENRKIDGDQILAYLGDLSARAKGMNSDVLSVDKLRMYGASIPLMPGVDTWFDRINRYAADNGIAVNHYIISSGLEEMIRGCKIGQQFKKIFACKYTYDATGRLPVWPSIAINYTTKTQFLFRINKGIETSSDDDGVNKFIEEDKRPMPFTHMLYFGDGDTDIPAMKLVKSKGGYSLAVFDEKKWVTEGAQRRIEKLISEERTNYVVPANYNVGSQLDVTVKGIIQLLKRKGK